MARKPSSLWCSFLARRTEAILKWVTAFSRTSPSFLALERLQEIDPAQLAYESVKPGPGGSVRLVLTPLELRDRLAVPIPPPHRHRHPYYGVLAPHVPLRAAVTALAGRRAETPVAQTPGGGARRTATRPYESIGREPDKPQKSRSVATRRDTLGPYCFPGSMSSSRCFVRRASGRFGSSPSSRRRRPCARSTRTWVRRHHRCLLRRPGARRCGRWPRLSRASSTRNLSRHRSANSISRSPGKSRTKTIRSGLSGTACVKGRRGGLVGHRDDPWSSSRCDSGEIFQLRRYAFPEITTAVSARRSVEQCLDRDRCGHLYCPRVNSRSFP